MDAKSHPPIGAQVLRTFQLQLFTPTPEMFKSKGDDDHGDNDDHDDQDNHGDNDDHDGVGFISGYLSVV